MFKGRDYKLLFTVLKNARANKLNRSLVGFSLQKKIPPLSQQDLLNFTQATKDFNPVYQKDNPPLPPLFISKLVFPTIKEIICHKNLKVNLLKLVQAEQKVTWLQVPRLKDELELKISLENIYDTSAGEMIEILAQILSGGKVLVESFFNYIVRGTKKIVKKKQSQNLIKNKSFQTELITEKNQQLEYALASGDNNLIHTSRFFAKISGLSEPIMHGACLVAMGCSSLSRISLDNDFSKLKSLETRFKSPAWPGEKLILRGEKKEKEIFFEIKNFVSQKTTLNGNLTLK